MDRKAQVSVFVIIGVVVLIGLTAFVLMQGSNTGSKLKTGAQESSLAGKGNAESFVQQCLEETVNSGIGWYGLENSNYQLAYYIDSNILGCLNNFESFKKEGYEVTFGAPKSTVEESDEFVAVRLDLPVTLKKGSVTLDYTDFEFSIARQTNVRTTNGVVKSGTVVRSEDGNLEFVAPSDVKVLDKDGNPIASFSLQLKDRNIGGRENSVVIGTRTYEGLPSGATFSPALKVTMKVDRIDLPAGIDPEEISLSFFNSETGVYNTFSDQSYRIDGNSIYYTASVDHFTDIVVAKCGSLNKGFKEIGADEKYRHIIEPVDLRVWQDNYAAPGETPGKHIIPEIMAIAACMAKNNRRDAGSDVFSDAKFYNAQNRLSGWGDNEFIKYNQNVNGEAAGRSGYKFNEKTQKWELFDNNLFSSFIQPENLCKKDYAISTEKGSLLFDWDMDDQADSFTGRVPGTGTLLNWKDVQYAIDDLDLNVSLYLIDGVSEFTYKDSTGQDKAGNFQSMLPNKNLVSKQITDSTLDGKQKTYKKVDFTDVDSNDNVDLGELQFQCYSKCVEIAKAAIENYYVNGKTFPETSGINPVLMNHNILKTAKDLEKFRSGDWIKDGTEIDCEVKGTVQQCYKRENGGVMTDVCADTTVGDSYKFTVKDSPTEKTSVQFRKYQNLYVSRCIIDDNKNNLKAENLKGEIDLSNYDISKFLFGLKDLTARLKEKPSAAENIGKIKTQELTQFNGAYLFATPMTYGYNLIDEALDKADGDFLATKTGDVGGSGYLTFLISDNGKSCINDKWLKDKGIYGFILNGITFDELVDQATQSQSRPLNGTNMEEAAKAATGKALPLGDQPAYTPFAFSGDNPAWRLNYKDDMETISSKKFANVKEGVLRAGLNVVRVSTYANPSNDFSAVAGINFLVVGTGLEAATEGCSQTVNVYISGLSSCGDKADLFVQQQIKCLNAYVIVQRYLKDDLKLKDPSICNVDLTRTYDPKKDFNPATKEFTDAYKILTNNECKDPKLQTWTDPSYIPTCVDGQLGCSYLITKPGCKCGDIDVDQDKFDQGYTKCCGQNLMTAQEIKYSAQCDMTLIRNACGIKDGQVQNWNENPSRMACLPFFKKCNSVCTMPAPLGGASGSSDPALKLNNNYDEFAKVVETDENTYLSCTGMEMQKHVQIKVGDKCYECNNPIVPSLSGGKVKWSTGPKWIPLSKCTDCADSGQKIVAFNNGQQLSEGAKCLECVQNPAKGNQGELDNIWVEGIYTDVDSGSAKSMVCAYGSKNNKAQEELDKATKIRDDIKLKLDFTKASYPAAINWQEKIKSYLDSVDADIKSMNDLINANNKNPSADEVNVNNQKAQNYRIGIEAMSSSVNQLIVESKKAANAVSSKTDTLTLDGSKRIDIKVKLGEAIDGSSCDPNKVDYHYLNGGCYYCDKQSDKWVKQPGSDKCKDTCTQDIEGTYFVYDSNSGCAVCTGGYWVRGEFEWVTTQPDKCILKGTLESQPQ